MIAPIEVASFQVGITTVGAIYLAHGIARSPMAVASEALGGAEAPKGSLSLIPIPKAARTAASGRIGLAFIVAGSLLQAVPHQAVEGAIAWYSPLGILTATVLVGGLVGRRWLRWYGTRFERAVWASPLVTASTDYKAMREAGLRRGAVKELRALVLLRRFFMPY